MKKSQLHRSAMGRSQGGPLVLLCLALPLTFVNLGGRELRSRIPRHADESSLWQEAYDTERSRSDLLLSKLQELSWKGFVEGKVVVVGMFPLACPLKTFGFFMRAGFYGRPMVISISCALDLVSRHG